MCMGAGVCTLQHPCTRTRAHALTMYTCISYEDQQRRMAEEIESLKERLQKHAEVHALDSRSNNEKVCTLHESPLM
jgi:hypothetical protein